MPNAREQVGHHQARTTALPGRSISRVLALAAACITGVGALAMAGSATAAARHGLTYEVTTTGSCSSVNFAGEAGVPGSEYVTTWLEDQDGDGVYTGSRTVDAGTYVVRLRAGGKTFRDVGRVNVDSNTTVRGNYTCSSEDADSYTGRVISNGDLNVRTGPSLGNRVVDSAASGARLDIMCKVRGRTIDGNSLWYRLEGEGQYWVSARYVANIGDVPDYCGVGKFFSGRTTTRLNYRAGPTTNALLHGTFDDDTRVRPLCKMPGERIDGNQWWYRLPEGRWASARYIEPIGASPPLCR